MSDYSRAPNLQVTAVLNQRLTRLECGLPQTWRTRYQKVRLTLVILCSRFEAFLHSHFWYQLVLRRTNVPPSLLFLVVLGCSIALTRRLYLYTANTLFHLVGVAYPVLQTVQTLLSLDGITVTLPDIHDEGRPSGSSTAQVDTVTSPRTSGYGHGLSTPVTGKSMSFGPEISSHSNLVSPMDRSFSFSNGGSNSATRPTTTGTPGRRSEWEDYTGSGPSLSRSLTDWSENSKEAHRWLRYWVLYSSMQLADHLCGWFLRYIPYYSLGRIVVLAWAQHPWSHTSGGFYRKWVIPAYRGWLTYRLRKFSSGTSPTGPMITEVTTKEVARGIPTPTLTPTDSGRAQELNYSDSELMSTVLPLSHSSTRTSLSQDSDVSSHFGLSTLHYDTPAAFPQLDQDINSAHNHHPTLDPLTQPFYGMDSMFSPSLSATKSGRSPLVSPRGTISSGSLSRNDSLTSGFRRRSWFPMAARNSTPASASNSTTQHYPSKNPHTSADVTRTRSLSVTSNISSGQDSTSYIRLSGRPALPPEFLCDSATSDLSDDLLCLQSRMSLDCRDLHSDPAFQPFHEAPPQRS
ncbi:hypothetical protein IWQ62_005711 [Dispira parvispora]|uniref:Uncharacterized protein n=1 Tax=Dispira parvispora TaxID=1520584 RepID=A0A9W8APX1_9FUNG|nr:hypothetical protein IWQ62_005711 [Dispira parvispora]